MDGDRPALVVTAPAGVSAATASVSNSVNSYTVRGTVSDGSGIRSITVNRAAASLSNNSWNTEIVVSSTSVTTVTVVATDNAGRTTTITRYVRGAYDAFKVLQETMGQESGEAVNWHPGTYSVADNTMTCNADWNRIVCNRAGKLHIYLPCRNSTGAGYQSNCSLYKNGGRVGGVTITANSSNIYSVTIDVNNGDFLQVRNDGGNGYMYVRAGAYLRWVR